MDGQSNCETNYFDSWKLPKAMMKPSSFRKKKRWSNYTSHATHKQGLI